MTRNQTKNRTETQNPGPEPCSALLSEGAVVVIEGDGATILQLNVQGLTNAKLIGQTLAKFNQLKRNKRFDNFIMMVWVQGSLIYIAARSHPVQKA